MKLPVEVGPVSFIVSAPTSNNIYSVVKQFCKNNLISWVYNPQHKKWEVGKIYSWYNKKYGTWYLPINYLPAFKNFIYAEYSNVDIIETNTPQSISKPLDMKMKKSYSPKESQLGAIRYLCDPDVSRKGLGLPTGCLDKDSIINFNRRKKGFKTTIKKAFISSNRLSDKGNCGWDEKFQTYVRSHNGKTVQLHPIDNIVYSGEQELFTIILENDTTLSGTIDHEILTTEGYLPIRKLKNKYVLCDRHLPIKLHNKRKKLYDNNVRVSKYHPHARKINSTRSKKIYYTMEMHRFKYEAHINNLTLSEYKKALLDEDIIKTLKFVDTKKYCIHHKDYDHYNNKIENLCKMDIIDHAKLHAKEGIYNFNQGKPYKVKVVDIVYKGVDETYDITCKDPYHNFVANGIIVHNSGKSYTSLYCAIQYNKPFIIIVSGLIEQWYNSILQFTNIKEKDIYVFQLTESIVNLTNSKHKPKVIVASIATVRNYIKAYKLGEVDKSFEWILRKYKIGTKIMDEVHLQFHALTQIDLRCNSIDQHFYLTATFNTNDRSTAKIFNKIYPDNFIYTKERDRKHVNSTVYAYGIGVNQNLLSTKFGYNHARYENFLRLRKTKFKAYVYDLLIPMIDMHFINKKNKNEKCLLYFATVNMIKDILPILQKHYKKLNIDSYIGADTEKKYKNDILLTTIKKTGCARDIPKVRTIINTVSTKALTTIIQIMGRARPMPNVMAEYVEIINGNIDAHLKHYRCRRELLRNRSKEHVEQIYNI